MLRLSPSAAPDVAAGKLVFEGAIQANPVSFNIDGQQCIAIAADRVLYVFGLQID